MPLHYHSALFLAVGVLLHNRQQIGVQDVDSGLNNQFKTNLKANKMTNAQFKKAAKEAGVKIYSLRKIKDGYRLSYCYILSKHTVSQQQDIEVYTEDLQEVFDIKFAK